MGGFWADVVRRVEWCCEAGKKKMGPGRDGLVAMGGQQEPGGNRKIMIKFLLEFSTLVDNLKSEVIDLSCLSLTQTLRGLQIGNYFAYGETQA